MPDEDAQNAVPDESDEIQDKKQASRSRVLMRRRVVAAAAGIAVLSLLVGGAGFALAGDGDGGGEGGAGGEELTSDEDRVMREEAAGAFARCMRDQGIDDFPDGEVEGDGSIMFEGLSDLGVSDERMAAANQACGPILDELPPPSEIGERSGGRQGEGPAEGQAEGEGTQQETEPTAAWWQEVTPGGDCQCSDGSEFNLWVREANPQKVVLFFQDGGACFSAETCDPDNGLYKTTITEGPDGEGIFDFADERNPFADHSVVYVPYCTGDVFLGNATTEYGPDLTIQHKGYVNGTAALDHLATTFPDATDVVVVGESAGSVAAPLYGGLVSDRSPTTPGSQCWRTGQAPTPTRPSSPASWPTGGMWATPSRIGRRTPA